MKISEQMIPEFDQEMENTRKLLSVLPDKLTDFKPHTKSMPLPNLAGHVAQLPSWATMTMTTDRLDMDPKSFTPFRPQSKQEVLAEFDKSVKDARAAILAAKDEEFMKPWTFAASGKELFTLPKAAVLRGVVFNHLIHHRAQLGVYLRMLDIEIPGMYGPSADEMKFWEQPA